MITELIGFYISGLLLSFTPCVLPMTPILFSIIVGKAKLKTKRAFAISLVYVISMALTYSLFGIIMGVFGESIAAYMQVPLVMGGFSFLFLVLGMIQLGLFNLAIDNTYLDNLSRKVKGGTFISAAIMGVLATVIASPCVTPALLGALTYISAGGDILMGGLSLFVLGLGIGTVLLIAGTLGGKYLPKVGPWMKKISSLFGILLLGMSLLYAYQGVGLAYPSKSTITDSQFTDSVSSGYTILHFGASWCSNCHELERNVLSQSDVKYKLRKWKMIDVDLSNWEGTRGMRSKYRIQGVPTLIFLHNGKEVGRIIGYQSKGEFIRSIPG